VRPAARHHDRTRSGWRAGALAAVAQLTGGELLAALLPRARSPVGGLGQTMIDFLPGPSVDMVVATAETKDKALLRAALAASALGSGYLAVSLETQGRGRGQRLLVGQGLIGGAAAASRPETSATSSLLAGLGAGVAGAGTLALMTGKAGQLRERVVLAASGLALGIAGALRQRERAVADRRREELSLPAPARPAVPVPPSAEFEIPGITPLFTPSRSFYVTDTALTAPRVDRDRWRLRVRGLVEHELEFSLQELLAMELVEVDATLVCVHNPVGGDRVGSARWLGVPLGALLATAGVRSESDQVLTHSVTGFTAGLPLETVGEGPIPLVALGMNGAPLTTRNGFPARLLTPGIWGADASTKWLATIELTTWVNASDYWDARGWPRVPGIVTPGRRSPANISCGSERAAATRSRRKIPPRRIRMAAPAITRSACRSATTAPCHDAGGRGLIKRAPISAAGSVSRRLPRRLGGDRASPTDRPLSSRCRPHGAVCDSSYRAGPDVGRLLERDPAPPSAGCRRRATATRVAVMYLASHAALSVRAAWALCAPRWPPNPPKPDA
jgi:DMSO/TMAO reductase YedYZ molybdopterin-dependent catalytic subunit